MRLIWKELSSQAIELEKTVTVSDLECPHQVDKKFWTDVVKKEEKLFLPDPLNKLKKRSEFLFIRNCGSSIKTKFFIINYFITNENEIKFGITISKKFGNSVRRNYVKRVIRSILSQNLYKYSSKIYFEVIPKKNIDKIRYQDLERDLISNLKNLVI